MKKEGFPISRKKGDIVVDGYDGAGVIYGCSELADYARHHGNLDIGDSRQNPEMVLRGACIGLQKTVYLPAIRCMNIPTRPKTSLGFTISGSGSTISTCW